MIENKQKPTNDNLYRWCWFNTHYGWILSQVITINEDGLCLYSYYQDGCHECYLCTGTEYFVDGKLHYHTTMLTDSADLIVKEE